MENQIKDYSIIEKIENIDKLNPDLNNLNQLFLIDEKYIKEVIKSAELNKQDIILEIGPGTGELTKELVKKVSKVIAVEIDKKFKKILDNIKGNVEIIFDDAKKYLKKERNSFNKLVSSPPYNLCEPLMHILTKKPNIELIILITPYGFYDKIKNSPIFSAFFDIKKIIDIPNTAFYPIPRIDSEIIKLTPRPDYERDKDEFSFLVRNLYIQKDKKIKNAIRSTLINLFKLKNKKLSKREARDIIKGLNLYEDVLQKKMQNYKPELYDMIGGKILTVLKKYNS